MGFITNGLLGVNSSQGTGFQAAGTPIDQPISNGIAQGNYDQNQAAIAQQQAFLQALQAQGGINNQSSVFNQQQALADQLQQQSLGGGPNPAQVQLAQATGANVAQQAALQAGQRGAGANVGLITRQAGQQGAAIQQNAVGQAATLQAQQQLAAEQALQSQQDMLGNTAASQVANQAGATSNLNQFTAGQEAQSLGQVNAQNQANIAMQSNINSSNAGVQGQVASGQVNLIPKVVGAIAGGGSSGAGAAAAGAAHGGKIEKDGSVSTPYSIHHVIAHLTGKSDGGTIEGETYANAGKLVPGSASVTGDSPKNDTVHAMLSPGEIIVPRSHATDPDKAAAFVRAVVMKNMKKKQ